MLGTWSLRSGEEEYVKQDEEELLLRQEEVQENVDSRCQVQQIIISKDGVSHKRDHSVALHHFPAPSCQATMLNPIFDVPSLIPTSNSLIASSVGFYQANSPWPRAANPARSRGGTWETDFQSLPLSTLVRPKDVLHLATLRQTPATTLGRSDRGIETKRCRRIPRAPAPCVESLQPRHQACEWTTSADSSPWPSQVSPNVLGFQVSTLIQNEAEMSCPHKALSSLQISEQNNCVHCFKLLNSRDKFVTLF